MNHLWEAVLPYLDPKNPITLLWLFRIGGIILLLGIFWPTKTRRNMLKRILESRFDGLEKAKWTDYLERLTFSPFFRWFRLDPESDEYRQLEEMIRKAGGLKGLSPNVIQLARVLLPPIVFISGFLVYLAQYSLAYRQYQEELIHPKTMEQMGQFFSFTSRTVAIVPPEFSFITVMWIGVGASLFYFLPKFLLKMAIRKRDQKLTKELHIMEQFLITLIEAKMTVYGVLKVLRDSTHLLRPYLSQCVSEYYVLGPEASLRLMADRVDHPEFRVICNVLEQAATNSNEYTLPFLRQHLHQFEQLERLREERKIHMKPMLYTLILGLPLGSIVIVYFYPFLVQALRMLHSF